MTRTGNLDDEAWMRKAIREARKGVGLTAPNPPVGAVIVDRSGKNMLGSGWHRKAGTPHAEVVATDSAVRKHGRRKMRGATIYVTLEPCSTHGRTPPCTNAIIEMAFARVVFGARDPHPSHRGRAAGKLRRAKILVDSGVMEAPCLELIRPFAKHITTGLPWVISKSALSLDGRITRPPGQSQWITGEAAREDVHRLRSEVDAILIGGQTARSDNPKLTIRGRHYRKSKPQPWRVVLTRAGRFPKGLHLFDDDAKDRTLVFKNRALDQVLRDLGNRGCLSVLLECGGNLMGQAFAKRLVDEVVWYCAPTILGWGVQAADIARPPKGWNGCQLKQTEIRRLGEDLRIRGLVAKPMPKG